MAFLPLQPIRGLHGCPIHCKACGAHEHKRLETLALLRANMAMTYTDLLALAATRPNTPPAPPTAGAYRQQLALTGFAASGRACLSRSPRTAKACLPSMPPPDFTLPRILPRPQATWQRQGVNFELLKQSVMHDFGVVLLFGSFFYLLPLCCWFELPPTAGQQCCFWSG